MSQILVFQSASIAAAVASTTKLTCVSIDDEISVLDKVLLFPNADRVSREAMALLASKLLTEKCDVAIVDDVKRNSGISALDDIAAGMDKSGFLAWARQHKYTPSIIEPELDNSPQKNESSYQEPDLENVLPTATVPELPPEFVDGKPSTWQSDIAVITWAHPTDLLGDITPGKLPLDMLPPILLDWITATAGLKATDEGILALSSIVACAALIHDGIKLQPEPNNPSWKESARLWCAYIGDSSTKKTPALNASFAQLHKIQIEQLEPQATALLSDLRDAEAVWSRKHSAYITKLSAEEPSEKPLEKPAPVERPEIPTLIVQDATIESLRDVLKVNRRGVISLQDELAGWLGSMDAYKSTPGADRAMWLEIFNGGPRWINRVGQRIFVPNWSSCISGGITPSGIKNFSKMSEDGLLQRFLVVHILRGKADNKPYNKPVNDRFYRMQQQLFDTVPDDSVIQLTPEANAIRVRLIDTLQQFIDSKFLSGAFVSHVAKFEGISARLMLTLHCVDCADRLVHPQSEHCTAVTAQCVSDLILKFLLPHSMAFYTGLSSNTIIGEHVKIFAGIALCHDGERIPMARMTKANPTWTDLRESDQRAVMQTLIDHGWLQRDQTARDGKLGIGSWFYINPQLKTIYAAKHVEETERRERVHKLLVSMAKIPKE